jgi:predicted outer membrane repeat protein
MDPRKPLRPPVGLLKALALAGWLLAIVTPAISGWNNAIVDATTGAGGTERSISIAPGSGSQTAIAYYNSSGRRLYYGSASAGNVWTTALHPQTGTVGAFCSTRVLSGLTVISFYDASGQRLLVSGFPGGVWATDSVDDPPGGNTGYYTSTAITATGTIYVTYYDVGGADCRIAGGNSVSGWTTANVATTGDVGRFASLALSGNNPVVVYFDATNGALKQATPGIPPSWISETIDAGTAALPIGQYCGLGIGSDLVRHVCYRDAATGFLWHARRLGPNNWAKDLVDSSCDALYTSLNVDAGGHPRVAYYDQLTTKLKTAYFDGYRWTVQFADTTAGRGRYADITHRPAGLPAIAYYDQTASNLRWAYLTDTSAPAVTLIYPNCCDHLVIGRNVTIQWTASDDNVVTSVDVELARDGVNFIEALAQGIPNSGSFVWTVSGPVATVAKIRVRARDIANKSTVDASDADFSISNSSALMNGLTFGNAQACFETWQIDLHLDLGVARGSIGCFASPSVTSDPLRSRVFALVAPPGQPSAQRLLTIDNGPVGPSTLVDNVDVSAWNPLNGLALDPFGTGLYTLRGPTGAQQLGRIDAATGTFASLGTLQFAAQPHTSIVTLAFSPSGLLYGLTTSPSDQGLYRINANTLQVTFIGQTSGAAWAFDDMEFFGDELWAMGTELNAVQRIDPLTGSIVDGHSLLTATGTYGQGLAMYPCVTATPELTAVDLPQDGGGHVRLDWSAYVPAEPVAQYEILRSKDPCELTDAALAPIATVSGTAPATYVDPTATDFTAYYYGVRAIGVAKTHTVTTLFAGPAFAFPNLLINEFAPSGGVPKLGGSAAAGVAKVGEAVEIRNLSSTALDLTGFRLSNGPGAPSPDEESLSGVIPGGGLLVHTLTVIDLPNEGGTLELLPPAGTGFTLDIVGYGSQGGAPTVPAGFTVSRVEGTGRDASDQSSFEASAQTLAQTNTVPAPALGQSILLNEVLYTSSSGSDYVELYNPLGSTVVLSQFALSDGVNFLTTLGGGLNLGPGQIRLLQQGAAGSFTQNINSNLLYLYKITSDGQYQRVDQVGWSGGPVPPPAPNDALTRVPDGLAVYLGNKGANWPECGGGNVLVYGPRTPGEPNAQPGVAQVVVDKSGGGNYLTINAALAAVASGTRVLVRPGTYNESIALRNGVEIVGAGGNPASIVITGGAGGNPIVTANGVDASAVLAGVTVRGGSAANGAGLLVSNNGTPHVRNVRFESNRATQRGGAIAVTGGGPTIDGCFFLENGALLDGGAIALLGGALDVERSLFVLNDAGARGGAVYGGGSGSSVVQQCVFDRNVTWGLGASAIHSAGTSFDVFFVTATNGPNGPPLAAEATGHVSFICGALFGNAQPISLAGGLMDTTGVMMVDPRYCQPLGFNYALRDDSPLLHPAAMCSIAIIGIDGPPCAPVLTAVQPPPPPASTRLYAPAPNPFNPSTVLRFDLAQPGKAALAVYDVRGRRVTELLGSVRLEAGTHEIAWHGLDAAGRTVASGVYFARLSLEGNVVGQVQRLVLLK